MWGWNVCVSIFNTPLQSRRRLQIPEPSFSGKLFVTHLGWNKGYVWYVKLVWRVCVCAHINVQQQMALSRPTCQSQPHTACPFHLHSFWPFKWMTTKSTVGNGSPVWNKGIILCFFFFCFCFWKEAENCSALAPCCSRSWPIFHWNSLCCPTTSRFTSLTLYPGYTQVFLLLTVINTHILTWGTLKSKNTWGKQCNQLIYWIIQTLRLCLRWLLLHGTISFFYEMLYKTTDTPIFMS